MKECDYQWGSNQNKSHIGNIFLDQIRYSLDTPNATNYKNAAAGYLHYILGVNPIGLVYLTNMNVYGATRSADEMFHEWMGDGTVWDNALTSPSGPAPGYLTGGANPNFTGTGLPTPPAGGQPIQKADGNLNTRRPQKRWGFSEPGIYYQAAFLHLLAHFVAKA